MIEPPTVEPMTVEEMKAALKIEIDADDTLVEGWIRSEREWIEEYLGKAIVEQTLVARMQGFPRCDRFELPRTNLIEVVSVQYVDTAGVLTTLPTSVYGVDTARNPGVIYLKYGESWPMTRAEYGAVTITYKAGYAPSDDSPPDLVANVPWRVRAALILRVGDRHENRTTQEAGSKPERDAATDLLQPMRTPKV